MRNTVFFAVDGEGGGMGLYRSEVLRDVEEASVCLESKCKHEGMNPRSLTDARIASMDISCAMGV